jgi:LysR family transcriptional regulator, glycine cleavage system transcriptional activator
MTDPLPPLSALRAFETAARTGSFSAAARELNVTHPAIAQQVRALETHLGLPLATGSARGITLTDDGDRLARALTDGFGTIRAALATLRQGDDAPLRITLTPAFAAQWLMPRLGAFWAKHADVPLSLHPDKRVVDLLRDRFDLAIRFGDGHWPGLDVQMLTRPGHVVVGAPSLLDGRTGLSRDEMAALPWIIEEDWPEQITWMARNGFDAGSVRATRLPEDMALAAARAGLGLHVEHLPLVQNDIAEGRLVCLYRGAEGADDLGYYLVTRPGPQKVALKTFLRWINSVA